MLASPDDACFLLFDDEGHAMGFAEATLHPGDAEPYAHLEGWYVAPEQRRRGHGKSLVSAVEQWCLHRVIRVLTSDTTPKYPLSAAAHAHAGFRKLREMTLFVKDVGGDPSRSA